MTKPWLGAALLMTLSLSQLAAKAEGPSDLANRVDACVAAELRAQRIPGLSLAVVKDGQVVLAKGYGLANVELDVPATAETVYEIGSMTKQFTATAVMMLVEEGKLGLDERIATRLAGIPNAWKEVTVRHLLTHTSGIMSYTALPDFGRLTITPATMAEVVKATGRFPLAFRPGEHWEYSNTGYYLLGRIVEKASGLAYGEFVSQRIFEPLGMTSTRFNDPETLVKHRAAGYSLDRGRLRNAAYVDMSWPDAAGAIVSTVPDLAKWDAALGTDRLLKPSSWQQMWTPATLTSGKKHPYGFGWDLAPTNGHRTIAHGGAIPGFLTFMARYPDDHLTVIVLTNADHSAPSQIVQQVAGLYVPALLGPALE
jgi:CubicO group peptidase (beta-lactamase class C family)